MSDMHTPKCKWPLAGWFEWLLYLLKKIYLICVKTVHKKKTAICQWVTPYSLKITCFCELCWLVNNKTTKLLEPISMLIALTVFRKQDWSCSNTFKQYKEISRSHKNDPLWNSKDMLKIVTCQQWFVIWLISFITKA